MPNLKIFVVAAILVTSGFFAAHNAKWIRDGLSPWWTSYFVSFVSATIYAYLLKSNLFPIVYTSVFQTSIFHMSWYGTAIFVLGEQLAAHKMFGLGFVFLGMILMSIR